MVGVLNVPASKLNIDIGPRSEQSIENYRAYAAQKLGVSEREVTPELARWLMAREEQVKASARAPFEKLLPKHRISTRQDAKKYFNDTYKAIGELSKANGAEKKRRSVWEKTNRDKWELRALPHDALAQGFGPDSPFMRYAMTKAEKNIGENMRDLLWRIRSTALTGAMPEHDGSEKSLQDMLDDARYAEVLSFQAIETAEHEASARFFELIKRERPAVDFAVRAEDTYERAKAGINKFWNAR